MILHIDTVRDYDIVIERGCINAIGEAVCALGAGKAALISDERVFTLHGEKALASLKNKNIECSVFTFPQGEKSKNLDIFGKIINFLSQNRITRGDVVIALGGGVTGDVAGFAAACYLRGVRYIQVPTTLLAMVDSSVGGKTAVDITQGKNLCGAFWQPSAVLCDIDMLSTLDEKYFIDGCGEIVKYAMLGCVEIEKIILEGKLFDRIDEVVTSCIAMKRDIVAIDERDGGIRRTLNFGHTVGHAVEALSGYTLSHGRCVAMGMEIITRAAVKRGICPQERFDTLMRLKELCKLMDKCVYSVDEIYNAALNDKKSTQNSISLIVPDEKGCHTEDVALCELRDWIVSGI